MTFKMMYAVTGIINSSVCGGSLHKSKGGVSFRKPLLLTYSIVKEEDNTETMCSIVRIVLSTETNTCLRK